MKNIQPDPDAVNNADNKFNSPEYDPLFLKQFHEIEERFIKEKESFQKEMFHRFKNNLQIITSLLNIQSGYVKDEDSSRMFINSAERVKTIAMIYDKQYQTENLDIICFDKYLKDLVNCIINNYDANARTIRNEISSVDVNLPAKTALSCGLIINELVSNSLKHAFVNLKAGKIKINLNHNAGKYILSVEDDGTGLPEDFDIQTNDSMGFLLVRSLTDQINGSLELISGKGTKFVIRFPEQKVK